MADAGRATAGNGRLVAGGACLPPVALLLDARLAQVHPTSCLLSSGAGAALSEADFDIGRELGAGKFGVARAAVHRASGAAVVLKEVRKADILAEQVLPQLRREVRRTCLRRGRRAPRRASPPRAPAPPHSLLAGGDSVAAVAPVNHPLRRRL